MKESKIPVTYSERQIMGYKLVLQELRDSDGADEIDSNFILEIHYKLFKFTTSHFAGKYKTMDNSIVARYPDGRIEERFKPLGYRETPMAINQIVNNLKYASQSLEIDKLILIPIFMGVFRFLCEFVFWTFETELVTNILI